MEPRQGCFYVATSGRQVCRVCSFKIEAGEAAAAVGLVNHAGTAVLWRRHAVDVECLNGVGDGKEQTWCRGSYTDFFVERYGSLQNVPGASELDEADQKRLWGLDSESKVESKKVEFKSSLVVLGATRKIRENA